MIRTASLMPPKPPLRLPKTTDEDLRLWHKVCESITPIDRRDGHHDALKAQTQIHILASPLIPQTIGTPPLRLSPFQIGQDLNSKVQTRQIQAQNQAPEPIEPGRKKRLMRERDDIEAVLDLHGLTSLQAETIVKSFVIEASHRDYRAVMIITGKGIGKNGILKSQTPQWLADARLRPIIAGIAQAHPRHGGAGALYVALKRKSLDFETLFLR